MKSWVLTLSILLLIQLFVQAQDVNISSVKLESQIQNVAWCGSDRIQTEEDETIVIEEYTSRIRDIIFLQTTTGEVYFTNNHGQKWANMTGIINNRFGTKLNGRIQIQQMQVSPHKPKTMYFFGKNGQSFVTEDCGKNLKIFEHEKELFNFKLNREDSDKVLAYKPKKCGKLDDECEEGENQIFVTHDQGQSWEKILDNVFEASWDKLIHFALVPDSRIIAHQRLYYSGKNNDPKLLTYSDDYYKSKKQIDQNVIHFYQSNFYLFVLTNSEVEDSYTLKIAPAFSQDYKPQELDLPVKRLRDHSFTILDSMHGSIYLAINHEKHDSKITNVYYSDLNGKKFSLSLMNVVRNGEGSVDFERILSIDGVFIGNIYDQQELDRIEKSKKDKNSKIQDNISSVRKSKISFNRGATWHSLKAPETSHKGEPYNCSGECSLHLLGRTDSHGHPIYSSEAAPGFILATGNVGLYLEERQENLNTYLSNDGGHTWLEVKQKPHIYEIADRGGLIVVGRSDTASQHVHYSWDHGLTWQEIKISEKMINIVNIVTEQSNMTQRFLVFGKRKGDNTNQMHGIVVALDFSKLHQRVCLGHYDPLDEESDFEFFMPKNYQLDKCQLGQRVKYVRRKPDAACFNPEEHDQIVSFEQCECIEEDYQCQFGYIRDEENNCAPMSSRFSNKVKEFKAPDNCEGTYMVPSGYEKIPGNFCSGGVDLGPNRVECPPKPKKFDPNEYIPLEEDVPMEMPTRQSVIRQNNSGSLGFWWYVLFIVVLGGLVFVFKEQIIGFIMSFMSGSQKQHQNNYYNVPGSSENPGLLHDDDEDEEKL